MICLNIYNNFDFRILKQISKNKFKVLNIFLHDLSRIVLQIVSCREFIECLHLNPILGL